MKKKKFFFWTCIVQFIQLNSFITLYGAKHSCYSWLRSHLKIKCVEFRCLTLRIYWFTPQRRVLQSIRGCLWKKCCKLLKIYSALVYWLKKRLHAANSLYVFVTYRPLHVHYPRLLHCNIGKNTEMLLSSWQ